MFIYIVQNNNIISIYIHFVNIFSLTKQWNCCTDYRNISGRCEGTYYYFSLLTLNLSTQCRVKNIVMLKRNARRSFGQPFCVVSVSCEKCSDFFLSQEWCLCIRLVGVLFGPFKRESRFLRKIQNVQKSITNFFFTQVKFKTSLLNSFKFIIPFFFI